MAQLDRPGAGRDARFHAIVTDLSGAPSKPVSADGEVARQPRTTVWGHRRGPGARRSVTRCRLSSPVTGPRSARDMTGRGISPPRPAPGGSVTTARREGPEGA
ncbi:hypothetical protein GCM10010515_28570 [Streptomyces fructofermentans]|uniref:Uncharacterized protein n=1 Tax=Streptomyces fructofermentans TaxID=152141 RepID=A0A918KE34_9ACTN|nr:hypothetical protein GCM10010515_28570 [Streptomyces fructofermentans]